MLEEKRYEVYGELSYAGLTGEQHLGTFSGLQLSLDFISDLAWIEKVEEIISGKEWKVYAEKMNDYNPEKIQCPVSATYLIKKVS